MSGLAAPLIVFTTLMQMKMQQEAGEAAKQQSQQAANAERLMSTFEAEQFEQQAGQVKAVSQRGAMEQRRQAILVASTTLANAAASGAGASDPTVVKIIQDISEEGSYRSALELYRGEEEARAKQVAAIARRYGGELGAQSMIAQGEAAQTVSRYQTLSTLLGGGTKLAYLYGRPPKTQEEPFVEGDVFDPDYYILND